MMNNEVLIRIAKKQVSEKSMETKESVKGQTIFKVGESADGLL